MIFTSNFRLYIFRKSSTEVMFSACHCILLLGVHDLHFVPLLMMFTSIIWLRYYLPNFSTEKFPSFYSKLLLSAWTQSLTVLLTRFKSIIIISVITQIASDLASGSPLQLTLLPFDSLCDYLSNFFCSGTRLCAPFLQDRVCCSGE